MFTIKLDIDGYEVAVDIHEDALEREIRGVEERRPEQLNRSGFRDVDLSRYTVVRAEPTDEKWVELAEDASSP